MKNLVVIVLMLFLASCAPTLQSTQLVCRHKALSIATAARQNYPVRVAIGKWKGINHVQPQAKVNSDWKYIKETRNSLMITHLDDFKVEGYMKLKEYFNTLMEGQK